MIWKLNSTMKGFSSGWGEYSSTSGTSVYVYGMYSKDASVENGCISSNLNR